MVDGENVKWFGNTISFQECLLLGQDGCIKNGIDKADINIDVGGDQVEGNRVGVA